jgi:hypothetical protein
MKIFGKIFNGLTLRCLGGITLGVAGMAVIIAGLAIYSGSLEDVSTVTASYTVTLPQDEAMLKELSDEIREGTDLAGEETKLDDIAPAAGAPLDKAAGQ